MSRVRKVLIGAIADCQDCDFRSEDYNVAQKEARNHFLKTGHRTTVELTYCQTYEKQEVNNEL